MINLMDDFELVFYKELGINERINDKQEQLEYLLELIAFEARDIEDIKVLSKANRKRCIKIANS